MYYREPFIQHPITKQPMRLYSEEVLNLLKLGYQEDELLMTKTYQNVNTQFIGNKDVDYQVLLNMDNTSLKAICQTNQYFSFLCQQDDFWKNKIIQDFPFVNINDIVDYKKYYKLLFNFKKIVITSIRDNRIRIHIDYRKNKIDPDKLLILRKKLVGYLKYADGFGFLIAMQNNNMVNIEQVYHAIKTTLDFLGYPFHINHVYDSSNPYGVSITYIIY